MRGVNMIELAKKLLSSPNESLNLTKAELHFKDGNFKKALKLFQKVDHQRAKFMEVICHKQLKNHDEAIEKFHEYEEYLNSMPESDNKVMHLNDLEELRYWIV
jgi:lipopolysaccharide biosynthesis regulator YciM